MTLSGITDNLSKTITREGIHHRFTAKTCHFFQEAYTHLFEVISKEKRHMNVEVFNQFKRINIFDSCSWKLPPGLKEAFKGSQGAGLKTQVMLDYKTGQMRLLDITEETFNDQKYAQNIDRVIQSNDLSIFDLGYAMPLTLKKINDKNAFFLCRYNNGIMNLYLKKTQTYQSLDILTVLKRFGHTQTIIELPCYLKAKENMVPIRFFAIRVPEDIANAKRRKLYKDGRRRGTCPRKISLELCNWTLLLSNIPPKKGLDVREIIALYPMRWSIELFFKQLKSILKVHKTEVKNNPHRLRCEVLGRCIVALFISYCYGIARIYRWRWSQREISFEKTVKYFKRNVATLLDHLFGSIHKAVDHIKFMIYKITETCQKHRQQSRKNSLDILIGRSIYQSFKYVKITRSKLLELRA